MTRHLILIFIICINCLSSQIDTSRYQAFERQFEQDVLSGYIFTAEYSADKLRNAKIRKVKKKKLSNSIFKRTVLYELNGFKLYTGYAAFRKFLLVSDRIGKKEITRFIARLDSIRADTLILTGQFTGKYSVLSTHNYFHDQCLKFKLNIRTRDGHKITQILIKTYYYDPKGGCYETGKFLTTLDDEFLFDKVTSYALPRYAN